MLNRIATLVGYWKAPRTTFMLRHPVKGVKAYLLTRKLKGLWRGQRNLAMVAAAAVPVGMWAASRVRNHQS
jgi:hypothetical protein